MANLILVLLYVLLAAVAGMIYSLRRIFILEKRILVLDQKITKFLAGHKRKTVKRKVKRKK